MTLEESLKKVEDIFSKANPSWKFIQLIINKAIKEYYSREIKTRKDKFFEIELSQMERDLFLSDEDDSCQITLGVLSEVLELDGGIALANEKTLCFRVK